MKKGLFFKLIPNWRIKFKGKKFVGKSVKNYLKVGLWCLLLEKHCVQFINGLFKDEIKFSKKNSVSGRSPLHTHLSYLKKSIKLMFLPANTTDLLHPWTRALLNQWKLNLENFVGITNFISHRKESLQNLPTE